MVTWFVTSPKICDGSRYGYDLIKPNVGSPRYGVTAPAREVCNPSLPPPLLLPSLRHFLLCGFTRRIWARAVAQASIISVAYFSIAAGSTAGGVREGVLPSALLPSTPQSSFPCAARIRRSWREWHHHWLSSSYHGKRLPCAVRLRCSHHSLSRKRL